MTPARPDAVVRSPFVGRVDALDHLRAAVAAARLGRFAGVLVGGPAGIGKSRLLEELVRSESAASPVLVVQGQALVGGRGALPLEVARPLVDLAGIDPTTLEARSEADQQTRLFQAVGAGLERAAAQRGPLLVALEDLHWADITSVELLTYLAHRLAASPVAVIATHRDGSDATPSLRSLLVALSRDPGVTRLTLGPLAIDDLAELAESRLGAPVDRSVLAQVSARSGGITLFAEELLDGQARDGVVAGVPPSLRDLFLSTMDSLGDAEREIVDIAAVAGGEIDHGLLAAVVDVPDHDLEKRIDGVLDVGVVVVTGDGRGYRFRHDLLRETVDDELRPAARKRLHGELARVLTARPDLVSHGRSAAADLAVHLRASGDLAGALDASMRAAAEAEASLAHAEALEHRLTALELFDVVSPPDADRTALLLATMHSASLAAEHTRAAALITEALEGITDPAKRIELLALRLAEEYLANDPIAAGRTARQALGELTDDAPPLLRSRLLAGAAFAFVDPTVPGTPLGATTEAVEIARAAGDRGAVMFALTSHGLALAAAGDIPSARAAFDEAELLAEDETDPRAALRPRLYRLLLGSDAETDIHLGYEAVARAERLGSARGVGKQMRAVLSDTLVATGRWDEARAVIDDGLAWGNRDFAGMLLQLNRASILLARGDLAAAEQDLAVALELVPDGHPRISLLSAELAWWKGDRAMSAMHAGMGLRLAVITARVNELPQLTQQLARGLPAEAPPEHLQPLQMAMAGLAARAGSPANAAWLATAEAERSADPAAWEAATSQWLALGHRPSAAYTAWRSGDAWDAAGDIPRARESWRRAESLARELGMVPILTALMGPAARRVEEPVERWALPDAESLGLTARETEVLACIAEGWTNKRIADELVISPRTVGIHVSNVLHKLGVSTRGEAAALVRRLAPG